MAAISVSPAPDTVAGILPRPAFGARPVTQSRPRAGSKVSQTAATEGAPVRQRYIPVHART
jgi:hypothetical protein